MDISLNYVVDLENDALWGKETGHIVTRICILHNAIIQSQNAT